MILDRISPATLHFRRQRVIHNFDLPGLGLTSYLSAAAANRRNKKLSYRLETGVSNAFHCSKVTFYRSNDIHLRPSRLLIRLIYYAHVNKLQHATAARALTRDPTIT